MFWQISKKHSSGRWFNVSLEVSEVMLLCGFRQLFVGKTVSLSSTILELTTDLQYFWHHFNAALVSVNVSPWTINKLLRTNSGWLTLFKCPYMLKGANPWSDFRLSKQQHLAVYSLQVKSWNRLSYIKVKTNMKDWRKQHICWCCCSFLQLPLDVT